MKFIKQEPTSHGLVILHPPIPNAVYKDSVVSSHFHFLVTLISNTIPLASSFNTRQETILLFFVLIFDCNPLFIHSSQIHLHVSSFSILFFVVWKKHSEIFMAQNRFILCMRHVNYRQNVESAWKNVHGLD